MYIFRGFPDGIREVANPPFLRQDFFASSSSSVLSFYRQEYRYTCNTHTDTDTHTPEMWKEKRRLVTWTHVVPYQELSREWHTPCFFFARVVLPSCSIDYTWSRESHPRIFEVVGEIWVLVPLFLFIILFFMIDRQVFVSWVLFFYDRHLFVSWVLFFMLDIFLYLEFYFLC